MELNRLMTVNKNLIFKIYSLRVQFEQSVAKHMHLFQTSDSHGMTIHCDLSKPHDMRQHQ